MIVAMACSVTVLASVLKKVADRHVAPRLVPPAPRMFAALLGLLGLGVVPLSLQAQGNFTNSATLSAAISGTNLVVTYSLTTTQGWVSLLTAPDLASFNAKTPQAGPVTVKASRTGQFLVPLSRTAPAKYCRLLLEQFPASLMNFPDLSDIIPPGQISIVGTGTNRMFQYTHDTFNGGSGPLEILPIYHSASGNYQGYQHVYTFSANQWTLVRTVPVAGAFVFDAAHGHFHFPFASYGLYASKPDGSIGDVIALSPKTGFCIADSFIHDPTLPHAGAFGNWGSCADPTSLRGLSIGAVDEYDQTDEGQAIPIAGVTNGVYWLRSMVDPYNYFQESNESNNETDTQIQITGNSVTVLQTVQPVLTTPPDISLATPAAGVVSGIVPVTLAPLPAGVNNVQFLVDGLPYGNVLTNPPYTLNWDTTITPGGAHWLAARATDATGHFGTTPVVQVNVTNISTIPPIVQLTDPAPGSIVSAVITVSATATAEFGVPTVQFYVDNVALGAPVTAPPYIASWNTEAFTNGDHVITAIAVDASSLSGTNPTPVTVTVDNSHPANLIGTNVMVFVDGTNTMETPVFSTTVEPTFLVAFVAYDGPLAGAQSATVTGAGLPWQLAKRSNSQHGTAEIWVASTADFLSGVTVVAQPSSNGYRGSLTVIAFTNAAGPGVVGQASAPTGAPDIFLPGVFAGNWVFAVGNDWDRAVARTPVSGQVLVHQRLETALGETFWVQSTTAPSTADGLVDIHDTAPTNDRWNYCAIEIVATRQ